MRRMLVCPRPGRGACRRPGRARLDLAGGRAGAATVLARPRPLRRRAASRRRHRRASVGSPVLAPAAGTVSFVGSIPRGGRAVTIQTADGYAVTLLQLGSTSVLRGSVVAEGDGRRRRRRERRRGHVGAARPPRRAGRRRPGRLRRPARPAARRSCRSPLPSPPPAPEPQPAPEPVVGHPAPTVPVEPVARRARGSGGARAGARVRRSDRRARRSHRPPRRRQPAVDPAASPLPAETLSAAEMPSRAADRQDESGRIRLDAGPSRCPLPRRPRTRLAQPARTRAGSPAGGGRADERAPGAGRRRRRPQPDRPRGRFVTAAARVERVVRAQSRRHGASAPTAIADGKLVQVAERASDAGARRELSFGLAAAVLAALGAAVALGAPARSGSGEPARIMGGDDRARAAEDPRRRRVAVRERPAPHRPCGGLRRPVRHLRPLSPAARRRRADGERHRRARHAGHGGRGRGGSLAA